MTPDIINILIAISPTIFMLGFLLLHQRQATQANLTAQRLEHDAKQQHSHSLLAAVEMAREILKHGVPILADYLMPHPNRQPQAAESPKPFDAEELARGWLAHANNLEGDRVTCEAIAWGHFSRVEQTKLLVACFGERTWDVETLDRMAEQERADLLWYAAVLLVPENVSPPPDQERLARARDLARDKIPF